jgi:hypothetical protein
MESRVASLFFLLLLLTGAAGTVLVVEDRRGHEPNARAESFQCLVGGLGFGPALDLSDCASNFDPRLEGSCSMDYGPIVGGACFSSRRVGSVFFYPPLKRGVHWPGQEKGDALSP